MKKVIFISALAIAAAASCTKSDIVDTKFGNEVIGFESYIGRAAQTKATVINDANIAYETIGLYGFYTGANPWKIGTHATTANAIESPTPNLWADDPLTNKGETWGASPVKYWTNATDYYSFLAYAPQATADNGLSATTTANPTVTYTVPVDDIADQIDLLYAEPVFNHQRRDAENPAPVALTMKHALSRIAVKANEKHPDYTYTIKALSLKGSFVKENTFSLVTSSWATVAETTPIEEDAYNFVVENANVTSDAYVACTGDKYLMVIPANVEDGVLTISYTTTYGTDDAAVTSAVITKEVEVSQNFKQGKAYTINLTFEPNSNEEIKFTVSVDDWRAEGEDAEANTETPVTPEPTNPEAGNEPQA